MSAENTLMIRYVGPDDAREYVIQRGDKMLWTGTDWAKHIDRAKKFTDHKAAQATVASLMHQRHKGKPTRKFRLNVTVTMSDDNVQNIPAATMLAWLNKALRLDIENAVYGDGPTEDSYVKVRLDLSSFQEVLNTE